MNKALSETRDKLFDARYLIEGMRLASENMSDEDEMKCLIQSLAKGRRGKNRCSNGERHPRSSRNEKGDGQSEGIHGENWRIHTTIGGSVIALLPIRWRIRYRTWKLRALMWVLMRLIALERDSQK
jgi:hypothetical protein